MPENAILLTGVFLGVVILIIGLLLVFRSIGSNEPAPKNQTDGIGNKMPDDPDEAMAWLEQLAEQQSDESRSDTRN
ncbi:MAG: hypothetical protein R6X32_17670 [Chloroflexota bacterium]|jgi:cell division protein FtsN